jgi:dTMP kinase
MPKEIRFFGEGLPYLKNNECKGKLIVIEGTDGVGRSTQIELLAQWLKVRGYGVVTTGWTRSKLMSKAIEYAKSGNMLDRMTFSLLYATDFADRLENVIIPALRSGFIVVADRYVYTAWVRDSLRDPSMQWIKDLYGFAPIPDLTVYLRIDVDNLIPRVIESGGMDYWESGMDLHLADNIYDSFTKYQKKMIDAYDRMAEELRFSVLDARGSVVQIQNDLRNCIEETIGGPSGKLVPFPPGGTSHEGPQSLKADASTSNARENMVQFRHPSLVIPGGARSSAVREKSFLREVVSHKDPLPDDKERLFSSIWMPSFHIPEDPQSTS